jgi:hypothetical protein
MIKKQYRTPNVRVGTVKKSMAAIASRWLRKNVSHLLPTSGPLGTRWSHRETVGSEIVKPSFSSSPWMRGAPHVGFSTAMRKISARISLPTDFRPSRVAPESHFQYSRPARCHPTTVLGVTRTKGFFHPAQSFFRISQNSFCIADKRRRGRFECKTSSCCRRARFSRIRFSRDWKATMIQPMR